MSNTAVCNMCKGMSRELLYFDISHFHKLTIYHLLLSTFKTDKKILITVGVSTDSIDNILSVLPEIKYIILCTINGWRVIFGKFSSGKYLSGTEECFYDGNCQLNN